jgi:hypothetical protein
MLLYKAAHIMAARKLKERGRNMLFKGVLLVAYILQLGSAC